MTKQQAREIIGKITLDRVSGEEFEALNIAIKALDNDEKPKKEIATKPIHSHHCPNCDKALPVKGITDDYCSECFNWNYCPNCGQKLDRE